jgi:hypothetical protein
LQQSAYEADFDDCCAVNLTSVAESGWGVISVSGPDRLSFLHGMATADFESASEGSYCRTNFLDNKGRLVCHNLCFLTAFDVKIICEPDSALRLQTYLDSLIFPMDRVKVKDESRAFDLVSNSPIYFIYLACADPHANRLKNDYALGMRISNICRDCGSIAKPMRSIPINRKTIAQRFHSECAIPQRFCSDSAAIL